MFSGSIVRMVLLIVLLPLMLLAPGCKEKEQPLAVNLAERKPLPAQELAGAVLNVCVGSMITPLDGYIYYQKLLDYLGQQLGIKVRALDFPSYEEVNQKLKSGEIELAFVCGGPYVEGEEQFGLRLLAVPEVNGRAEYYSYLIVPADSPASSLADLRGKTFAFADPKSNSGFIAPSYQLAQMQETPESFFSSFLFTYAHDRSIRIVADRLVDGAAVDSLIWDYLLRAEPQLAQKVKVVAKSPPYGMPPVVAGSALDPELGRRITDLLLHLHLDPQGQEILRGMGVDRFVPGDDSSYDSIRQMRQFLARPTGDRKEP